MKIINHQTSCLVHANSSITTQALHEPTGNCNICRKVKEFIKIPPKAFISMLRGNKTVANFLRKLE